jgi:pyrroline-5-carboxylate reductase
MEKTGKICIIGAGTIGGSIARALAAGEGNGVIATRRRVDRIRELEDQGVTVTSDNRWAASESDIVILAVKPNQVVHVLQDLDGCLEGKIVISFAAAIPTELIQKVAPASLVIRAMTNTAVQIRQGYTVYACGEGVKGLAIKKAEDIFRCLGAFQKVDEQYLDVLTAMSGSGPAYIYTVIESMIYGALRVGLPRDLALQAVAHTAIGASQMLLVSGKHPAELRDMVVTPGGVTIEGIYELEESRIRTAFMKAVCAASEKASSIASEARNSAEEDIRLGKLELDPVSA